MHFNSKEHYKQNYSVYFNNTLKGNLPSSSALPVKVGILFGFVGCDLSTRTDVLTTAQRICEEYEKAKTQGGRLPWNCASLYVLLVSSESANHF